MADTLPGTHGGHTCEDVHQYITAILHHDNPGKDLFQQVPDSLALAEMTCQRPQTTAASGTQ